MRNNKSTEQMRTEGVERDRAGDKKLNGEKRN
jgi:hypothetical protein